MLRIPYMLDSAFRRTANNPQRTLEQRSLPAQEGLLAPEMFPVCTLHSSKLFRLGTTEW